MFIIICSIYVPYIISEQVGYIGWQTSFANYLRHIYIVSTSATRFYSGFLKMLFIRNYQMVTCQPKGSSNVYIKSGIGSCLHSVKMAIIIKHPKLKGFSLFHVRMSGGDVLMLFYIKGSLGLR